MVVFVGITTTAIGVRADESTRALIARAVEAKERALDSMLPEDWTRALEMFQDAHTVAPTAGSAYEIGFAAAQLHLTDVACEAYRLSLELGLDGVPKSKADQYLQLNEDKLSELDVDCPAGSRVFVRGVSRGKLPRVAPVIVAPGPAEVECLTETNAHLRRSIVIRAGGRLRIVLETELPPQLVENELNVLPSREAAVASHQAQVWDRGDTRSNSHTRLTHFRASAAATPGTDSGSSRAAWVLVGTGASLAVVGTVLAFITNVHVDNGRQALANACAVQLDGPNTCRNAKSGLQSTAQSHADSIATWRTFRTIYWTTAGAGTAATLGGASVLLSRWMRVGKETISPRISFETNHLEVSFESSF